MGESFGGTETRLMHAVEIALRDIRQSEPEMDREEIRTAEIILISDGRSSLLPYVQEDIRNSGVQLHVVALGTHRNTDLEAVAATYSSIPDAHNLQSAFAPRPAPLGSLLPPGAAAPRSASPAPSG